MAHVNVLTVGNTVGRLDDSNHAMKCRQGGSQQKQFRGEGGRRLSCECIFRL